MAQERWEVIEPILGRGSAYHLEALPNDDFLVAGHASTTSPYLSGMWIARYSPSGDKVWSREFTGMAHSPASDLFVEKNRILIVGAHSVPNPFKANTVGFAAELGIDGDVRWEKRIEQDGASVWINALSILEDGDLLLSGTKKILQPFNRDAAFYARLSPEGKVKWTFSEPPRDEYYTDLPAPRARSRDKDGNQILRETAGPAIEQDDGTLHLHIIRRGFMPNERRVGRCVVVSSAGNRLEDQTCARIDEPIQRPNALSYDVRVNQVGPGFVGVNRIEVSKLDENDEVEWTWQLKSDDKAGLTDALSTADGGVIGIGYFITEGGNRTQRYDALVFRLDASGKELWARRYQSKYRDIFARIIALDDETYIVAGHTGAGVKAGWWEPWLLRIGGDGLVETETEIVNLMGD